MSYLGEAEDFRGQTISRPPGKSNAVSQVSSYLGEGQDFAKQNQQSLFSGNQNNQQNNNNSGIQAFQQTQQGGSGGGSGSNIAQQVLGDAYNQAIGLGYKPSELIDMIANAQAYGQGINVDKFKTDLDRYEGFLDADVPGGGVFKFEDDEGNMKQYLNVSRPEVTANPPEGVMGLLGAMFSPFADLAGAGAKFLLEGGATGKILGGLKDQFSKGKGFLGDVFNPGDIAQRLDAAGPEAKRKYAMFMQQGDPYQVAFQKATGQAFVRGGVANL